jgi:hypothetical protein
MIRLLVGVLLALSIVPAFAEEAQDKIKCPDKNPCRVLFISEAEFAMLMGEKGVLATAAQARNLDLGAFATYMQTKLITAPQGEPRIDATPTTENKPVDKH